MFWRHQRYAQKVLEVVVVVQSAAQACPAFSTLWTTACQAPLSFTISPSLLKLMSIESLMPSNHLILYFPLFSCPQSFPASGSFPLSQLFASDGQSIGASALASVLPINIQGWFPLGLTGLISLHSKGVKSLLQYHSSEASVLQCSAFFMVQLSYPYMISGKTIALTRRTLLAKLCLCFLIHCLVWS